MDKYKILTNNDLNNILSRDNYCEQDIFIFIENAGKYLLFDNYDEYSSFVKEKSEKDGIACHQIVFNKIFKIIFTYKPEDHQRKHNASDNSDLESLKQYVKLCFDLKTFPIISYNNLTSCYQIVAENLSGYDDPEFYPKLLTFIKKQFPLSNKKNEFSEGQIINNYYIGSINNNTNGNNNIYMRNI